MTRIVRIKDKLDVLKPHYCKVIDESSTHAGHFSNATESHLRVIISSDALSEESLLTQHKIINKLLEEELASGLHALSINIVNKNSEYNEDE